MSNMRRDDVDKFFSYSIHIPSRTLYMGDEVDEEMAELFLKGMTLLQAMKEDSIHVIMNNTGGDEYHGLAIFDAIATSKCHVTITAYGHAMSMGSWILQAADERILAPNCTVMVHYGVWYGGDAVRNVVLASAKEMERLNRAMEASYLKRMKQVDKRYTLRKLQKLLETDSYFTAEEAVEMGLADRILEVP
jgi:ATP-dependent Clp protease protease subunit